MPGVKGMRWKRGRQHSKTVAEALRANEDRLPELMDDLYDLAIDLKGSRKERLEALKFLVEKAAPRQVREEQTRSDRLDPALVDRVRKFINEIKQSSGLPLGTFSAWEVIVIVRYLTKAVDTQVFKETWTRKYFR